MRLVIRHPFSETLFASASLFAKKYCSDSDANSDANSDSDANIETNDWVDLDKAQTFGVLKKAHDALSQCLMQNKKDHPFRIIGYILLQILDDGSFQELKRKSSRKVKRYKKIRDRIKAVGKCAMCGSTKELTIDHIIPRCFGGTNKISNLQCLCRRCNCSIKAKEEQIRAINLGLEKHQRKKHYEKYRK